MHEVNDVVCVASDLSAELHRGVTGGMLHLAGKYVTIKTVSDGERFRMYTLKEDPWGFIWTDWMFESDDIPLEISEGDMDVLL